MATYQKGVITTGQLSAAGLFQSRNLATALETTTAEDEKGNTAAALNFNPTEKASFDMVLDTSATTFDALVTAVQAAGSAATPVSVTVGTTKYLVDGITKTEGNKAYKRGSVDATRWTKNGIPA
jgi:Ca2+-binding RTX toxin-like protein